MPDEDGNIFAEACRIYEKYRWTEMKSPEQWMELADEVRDFAEKHRWRENALALRAGMMLMDVFSDMYRDGKKPEIPDYFGRSDL